MTEILQAARSYYGLADAKVRKTEWFTDEGKMILCFEIVTDGEDFIGIVERMKRLQEEHPMSADHKDDGKSYGPFPSFEAFADYNHMGPEERAAYCEEMITISPDHSTLVVSPGERKVAHIDTPETEEPTTMDAVWLEAKDCSQAQMMHASDADLRSGRHLVPWSMLTEEQRQKAKESKA